MMCFTVFKKRKKQTHQTKRINPHYNMLSTLPDPKTSERSLQSAPSSFIIRTKPTPTVKRSITNSKNRVLSAPSSFNTAEPDDLESINFEENDESNHHARELFSPTPQPLPLPSLLNSSFKISGSLNSMSSSGPLNGSGPLPLPPSRLLLRSFSYEEIALACHNFIPDRCMSEGLTSMIYKASFVDDTNGSQNLEATVTRLNSSTRGVKEFVTEVNTLVSLQHPNLCKIIGYHAREGSEHWMLVYERLFHGSLDRVLCGRFGAPPIDWNTRMKVALCAAQGLAFLHEEGPFQAMYNDFSAANIQIDKDFSAKLSGYGCVSYTMIFNNSLRSANVSTETVKRGLLTPKSNVWSFGIVILEMLTGRRNLDSRHLKEECSLVKWSRPFLSDDSRLSLIMDPQFKGRFPPKAVRTVADLAQRCLQTDPLGRPTMRTVVELLKTVQDMKHSCRFPLQDPSNTHHYISSSHHNQ